ncbi:FtsX-like permease family protein [Buchnera aphidicola]|uniref:Membrane component of lipoprotein export ABC transporter n=1 Tax=Buchnera aphidicola str. Ua (Uroleucon ambrosiae) TaxID=1005057 RepID=G2LPF6_BUCUM|nr:ABC transporter permease [Buchnera aphidicola]AEO08093.1 membrane component of lipoprotein export ABC transporter [Buchnera aphidicola str. Ua (Uroleucon ambrosiae)]
MYKPIYLFIALRYLWNINLPNFKKFYFLSITSIMISTFSIVITISVINGSENNFKKNIISFIPHLIITNHDQYVKKSDFPKQILNINNIKKVSDLITKEIIVQSKNNISIAEIIGIDETNNYNIKNYNQKDILKILNPGQYNIVIGTHLAKKLHVYVGDKINLILLSNKKNNFSGQIFNQHIFKIVNIFSTQNEIDYYQIIMNKKDSLNFLKYSKNYVSGWRIWLHDPLNLNLYEFKKIINKLTLIDWKLQKGELFKAMKIEKYIMLFLFFLILIISILNIFINLTTYIVEHKYVIAILQIQGLSNWKIMLIFIIFGSGNAIIGSIIGTIIAIVLIMQNDFLKFFISYCFKENDISIIMIPSQILCINMISILLAIFSTLYPTWNAVQSKSARVLSNE